MNYGRVTFSYVKNACFSMRDLVVPGHVLARNKELRDRHRGERCFILGSGGSIRLYDLPRLEGHVVMTQNNFFVHEDIAAIRPRYQCTVPYYHPAELQSTWVDWITDMQRALPDATFFWEVNTRDLIERNFATLAGKSYYLRTRHDLLTLRKAKVDITKTIMTVPTALTECLTVAMYLGFSPIVLLGFDYDQICSKPGQNFQNRFYGLSKITDTDAERAIDVRDGEKSATGWFNRWLNFKQLFLIKDFADTNGIEIINGSEEGILHVFPRAPVGHNFEHL